MRRCPNTRTRWRRSGETRQISSGDLFKTDGNLTSRSTDPAGSIPIQVMNLHKHLIALFAEYDGLTKRVRAYPCGPGSARERVQVAIARQASLFMAKEAGVLQVRFRRVTSQRIPPLTCCVATPTAASPENPKTTAQAGHFVHHVRRLDPSGIGNGRTGLVRCCRG